MSTKLKFILSLLVVIIWIGLITYLSSQPAEQSNSLSKNVTEKVVETIDRVIPEYRVDLSDWNQLIRKNAHFFIYLVLGVMLFHTLRFLLQPRWKSFVYALGICVLYAIVDEWHQLYVPGRGAQLSDVMIDSIGALTGIVLYLIIMKLVSRRDRHT